MTIIQPPQSPIPINLPSHEQAARHRRATIFHLPTTPSPQSPNTPNTEALQGRKTTHVDFPNFSSSVYHRTLAATSPSHRQTPYSPKF